MYVGLVKTAAPVPAGQAKGFVNTLLGRNIPKFDAAAATAKARSGRLAAAGETRSYEQVAQSAAGKFDTAAASEAAYGRHGIDPDAWMRDMAHAKRTQADARAEFGRLGGGVDTGMMPGVPVAGGRELRSAKDAVRAADRRVESLQGSWDAAQRDIAAQRSAFDAGAARDRKLLADVDRRVEQDVHAAGRDAWWDAMPERLKTWGARGLVGTGMAGTTWAAGTALPNGGGWGVQDAYGMADDAFPVGRPEFGYYGVGRTVRPIA